MSGLLSSQSSGAQKPSPSASLLSDTPQPQPPGSVFWSSDGQPSLQSAVSSPSVSVSGFPQPHCPGSTLAASFGQPSLQLTIPSRSVSPHAPRQSPWLR